MDPIKKMISATDPLRDDPSGAVDGEAALRRILSEQTASSDSIPAGVVPFPDRRLRRARLAGVLTLAAAVAAGVLVAINLGPLTSATLPAATTSETPTPTVTSPAPAPSTTTP